MGVSVSSLVMSIEVHVNTSVSPLRTCIKVLTEHICMYKQKIILKLSFTILLSLSLPRTLSVSLSPLFSVFTILCCCLAEAVVSV